MSKSHHLILRLALAAVLTSIGVVLKVLSFTTLTARVTFFDTIVILVGITMGPLFGLAVGFAVDLLDFFLFPKGFPFSYIIFIGTVLTGFIPGLYIVLKKKMTGTYKLNDFSLAFLIVITTTIAFLITTYQMYVWSKWGLLADLPFRLIVLVLKWPIQFYVIKLIYNRFYDKFLDYK